METLIDLALTHGPYIAIALVVGFSVTAAKKAFAKFFKTPWGLRLLYFLPGLIGMALGLFLPEESLKLQLLYGFAMGTVAQTIYSIFTKALRPNKSLLEQIAMKDSLGSSSEGVESDESAPL
jgi:hypothetical protein